MSMKRLPVIILTLIPLVLLAGTEKKPDTWEPFQFLTGKWQGTGEGKSGEST